jgi:hypothetical protein
MTLSVCHGLRKRYARVAPASVGIAISNDDRKAFQAGIDRAIASPCDAC